MYGNIHNRFKKWVAFTLLTAMTISTAVVAGESVDERLKVRRDAFAAKAPEQKKKDYAEGIRLVKESGVLDKALQVGQAVPDFVLPDAYGKEYAFKQARQQGPVVIIWYRGEWCPYCNIYIQALQERMDEFTALGASVVAIAPEKIDHALAMANKNNVSFPILSDEGNVVAKKFGVAYTLPEVVVPHLHKAFNIQERNGDDSNILPLAASYVVDTDGTVLYAFLDEDYRKRAEVDALLDAVKKAK